MWVCYVMDVAFDFRGLGGLVCGGLLVDFYVYEFVTAVFVYVYLIAWI